MEIEMEFSERIKSVFDVCDSEGTGYITVDHLKDLARDHFGADNEEVKRKQSVVLPIKSLLFTFGSLVKSGWGIKTALKSDNIFSPHYTSNTCKGYSNILKYL